MALLMSQTEFAARRKVGKSAVSNWKNAGLLVFADDPDRPGKKLVDAEKSDLLVGGSIDPTRGRPRSADLAEAEAPASQPSAPARVTGIEAARLEEMQERTRRRRIDTEQLLNTLVPIAEFERRAGDMGRKVREGVRALVRQNSERWAAETDRKALMMLMEAAFDGFFGRLADEIEAEANEEREVDRALVPLLEDDDEADAE